MTQNLVIIGAGGHGREVADIVRAVNAIGPRFRLLGFLDDEASARSQDARLADQVLGPISLLVDLEALYLIGVGSPIERCKVDARVSGYGREAATLVHPSASVGSRVTLSPGAIVAAQACITTNVVLGPHAHINVRSSLSHDCNLGGFVTVSPGATICGGVEIAEGAMLGAGSVVLQGLSVGAWAVVGAGAVVTRSVAAHDAVSGVPARSRR